MSMSWSGKIYDSGFADGAAQIETDLANEKAAHQGALLRERMLAQRIADMEKWLRDIVEEVDDYDDHDGRLGHISFATITLARRVLPKVEVPE